MTSQYAYLEGEQGAHPVAALTHLLGTAAPWALGLAAGLVLARPAARALRGAGLHWSWAPAAAAAALVARGAIAGIAPAVVLAGARAGAIGRRWHREDVVGGPQACSRARGRITPGDALLRLGRWARERTSAGAPCTAALGGGLLTVGRDRRGRPAGIAFAHGPAAGAGDRVAGGRHTLVVGATGSGKTVTQSAIACAAIAHGFAAVVVDPKGDGGMRSAVRAAAARAGRPLVVWSPRGGAVYNPFARGSETEVADKALAGETFTEPHYLRQAQRYLGHAVRALRAGGEEVSLGRIVEVLVPAELERLSHGLDEEPAAAVQAYLDALTSRQRSDLAGVRDRLAILAESDVGAWLDPGRGPAFDLLDTVRSGAVAYFDLEADTRPLLTQMVGAAVVQDLLTTVAALQARPAPALVVIDEFSAIAAEQVVRLFARARSAGVSLLLGTQELSDLRLPGRERLLEQVAGNLSTLIAHRQVVPRSAELVATLAGSADGWRISRRGDGPVTHTRVREEALDPTRVMRLGTGEAVLLGLEGAGRVQIARITPPNIDERNSR